MGREGGCMGAWNEREVGVAVDMEIARRAGVFVGNGVSKITDLFWVVILMTLSFQ